MTAEQHAGAPGAVASPALIEGIEGFRARLGQTLGPSLGIEITQGRIDAFCQAVDNDEWTHWDEARCQRSRFGTTIAPAAFVQALFPAQWRSLAEVRGLKSAVIAGSDRFRLLQPLRRGLVLVMTAKVDIIEPRPDGAVVVFEIIWSGSSDPQPVAVGQQVLRLFADEALER